MEKEDIIKALECCTDLHKSGRWASGCIACPYAGRGTPDKPCHLMLIEDAAKALKDGTNGQIMAAFAMLLCNIESDSKKIREGIELLNENVVSLIEMLK